MPDGIRCPHCNVLNQEVTPKDPCWKCGTLLNAPVAAAPEPTPAPPTPSAPVLLQKEGEKPAPASSRATPPIALIATILIAILLVVVYFLRR